MKILISLFLLIPNLSWGDVIYLSCKALHSKSNIEIDIDYEKENIWIGKKRFEIQEINGRIITAYAETSFELLEIDRINGDGHIRHLPTTKLVRQMEAEIGEDMLYFEKCEEIKTKF